MREGAGTGEHAGDGEGPGGARRSPEHVKSGDRRAQCSAPAGRARRRAGWGPDVPGASISDSWEGWTSSTKDNRLCPNLSGYLASRSRCFLGKLRDNAETVLGVGEPAAFSTAGSRSARSGLSRRVQYVPSS